MEIYAVIAAIWLVLFVTYYFWPSLRRRSAVYPTRPALRSRIVSTSYLQNESELARYRRQVEEAKAALAHPAPRRAPVVSETVPSAPVAATPAAAASTVAEPAPIPAPAFLPLEPLPVGATASLARSQPLAQAFGGGGTVATAVAVDAAEVAYLRSQVAELRRELAVEQSRPRPEPRVVTVDHTEEVAALQEQVAALEEKLAMQAARPKRVARPATPRPASTRPDTARRHHHPAGDYTELPPSLRALVGRYRRQV